LDGVFLLEPVTLIFDLFLGVSVWLEPFMDYIFSNFVFDSSSIFYL